MDITAVPFVAKVGLQRSAGGQLCLPASDSLANHLGTVHASAQFTLAETASGDGLFQAFPDLAEQVVAVVRDARVKFRQPATSMLSAQVAIDAEAQVQLREQFARKDRAFISVAVTLRDVAGVVTCEGQFDWYVQRRPEPASI